VSAAAANPKSQAPEQKARRRAWPWILAIVVLAAAGAGGWWWWQDRQAAAEDAADARPDKQPAQYIAVEPSFVVNLADPGGNRYLQADVQVVSRDPATVDAVHAHLPSVRNRLLLLFGQQESTRLAQRAGKERLQEVAREEVRALLRSEGAPDKVEAVIFTSLVTQ
jgi:flagellar FliL protein